MDILKEILPFFPTAYIYNKDEIIIEPKNNVYFRIDNISNKQELDCKMIEWCSRPSCKGTNLYWQRYMLRGINSYFKQTWTKEQMMTIYTYLGNQCNRRRTIQFIESDFDLNIFSK